VEYISTRGHTEPAKFADVVISSLAPDAGLYVPGTIPKFSPQEIAAMAGLSYEELVFKIVGI